MSIRRIALLTAGGFAPCLSAAVGDLIERYIEVAPDVEIIAYSAVLDYLEEFCLIAVY